ncbi:C-GCAxxG-C-C family protein [Flavobacteriaceae bacterium D16]|nr:C-GCAxxG-C-C family protein [Flavobacteriaceae bacterium D16]
MESSKKQLPATKTVFKECGACSHTFAHILNREFGNPNELTELALNPLAGGIMNQSQQCGMIWGAALAVGAESYRRHKDQGLATAVAIRATKELITSFEKRSKTVNCGEILGYSLSNILGIARLMVSTTLKGMENSKCFDLAEAWAPEAIQSAKEGLDQTDITLTEKPASCASEVVRKMGGSEEEILMVAGFAGGLGLSGNACGALSAAIWMQTFQWCRKNPGKIPPYFKNKPAKRILKTFKKLTGAELLCEKITGQKFENINSHATYLKNGGCEELIDGLAATALMPEGS